MSILNVVSPENIPVDTRAVANVENIVNFATAMFNDTLPSKYDYFGYYRLNIYRARKIIFYIEVDNGNETIDFLDDTRKILASIDLHNITNEDLLREEIYNAVIANLPVDLLISDCTVALKEYPTLPVQARYMIKHNRARRNFGNRTAPKLNRI